MDLTQADSSVDTSLALGTGKPSSCSKGSTVTTQAQASSTPDQTCSLRPCSTSVAVSSSCSASNTPVPVVTLDSPDVDPKSQGQPVHLKSQAAVKYLVSQVKTLDTSEHDDDCDEDEEIVIDEGCVGAREVKGNVMRGNSAGIIAPSGWKNVTTVPEKKVINHNDEISSKYDLDDGNYNLSCQISHNA